MFKERWQIEIFFPWIKQNPKTKALLDNSENAVMNQIYLSLIAFLLLCYSKFLSVSILVSRIYYDYFNMTYPEAARYRSFWNHHT
jgi:IS4 transposase